MKSVWPAQQSTWHQSWEESRIKFSTLLETINQSLLYILMTQTTDIVQCHSFIVSCLTVTVCSSQTRCTCTEHQYIMMIMQICLHHTCRPPTALFVDQRESPLSLVYGGSLQSPVLMLMLMLMLVLIMMWPLELSE